MKWFRTWRIDSESRWRAVLHHLGTARYDFVANPVDIILKSASDPKTHDQRKLFHAVCADLAPHWHLTPGETKSAVKVSFYGVDHVVIAGIRITFLKSSEDSDKEEYSRLIEHSYQMAAESGVEIQDRRRVT